MTRISQLVVMGDSLSDRGTLDKRKLLDFIPMNYLSGLSSKSPRGRFTNGFLWGDYVCATTVEQFEIDHERRKLKLKPGASSNADISDAFLTKSSLRKKSEAAFSLNDDMHVLFKGKRFARFHCEGGLTAHDYATSFTFNPGDEGTRLIVATLEAKRKQLLEEDKKYKIAALEKIQTLVIEWSGANDEITVNTAPTYEATDKAINARIQNIEQLIQNGYRNFALFNLPDIALTPRYQAKSKKEQENAAKVSQYFNARLAEQCVELNNKYKDLHIPINLSVFDIDSILKEVYNDPERYGFDRDKLKTPYTTSEQFKQNEKNPVDLTEHISPSNGYMFWDDIHPTADLHAWLAEKFKTKYYGDVFNFLPPDHVHKSAKKTSTYWNDIPKPAPKINLPEDVINMLDTLHENAKSMCESSYSIRREKGELLKQFIFELKCQKGNLEEIHGFISAFTLDTKSMALIKTHNNPIFDFFARIKTTRSEDIINALANTVKAHITNSSSQMSL